MKKAEAPMVLRPFFFGLVADTAPQVEHTSAKTRFVKTA